MTKKLKTVIIDYKGNCGNISSAVGPFAVDEGLVMAQEPITRVRIHQFNTDKLITAEVPVKNGRFDEKGDYAIAGVPGAHSRITLRFADPGGALTGKLFPTGNRQDDLEIPRHGTVAVTIIDAANPVVPVRAEAIGLTGTEIDEIDTGDAIKKTLETIRCKAAVLIGLAASEEEATQQSLAVPKMAFITTSKTYTTTGGQTVAEPEIDITARIMSMGTLHRSYAVSGGISTAGAQCYRETGAAITPEAREAFQRSDSTLKGPVGLPDVRLPDGTEAGLLGGELRVAFDLYANVRPIRLYPNVASPLINRTPDDIDYVIVRKNCEGLYLSRGVGLTTSQAATDTLLMTARGCQRISRFAFDLASAKKRGAPEDGKKG